MISLGITGSRQMDYAGAFNDFKQVMDEWMAEHGRPDLMVSGGAKGADTHAMTYATINNIPFIEHLPKWHLKGSERFYSRNRDLVGDSTHILAFPSDARGRDWATTRGGTQWTMREAQQDHKYGDIHMTIKWIEDLPSHPYKQDTGFSGVTG